MIFSQTPIEGAWLVNQKKIEDERGFFARAWCEKEFADHGITSKIVQVNNSFNRDKGTIRGMHYQKKPYEEMKVVRCIRGSIFDVIVDLRKDSASYMKWYGAELSSTNRTMLVVPEGCAHGFQTLEDISEIVYMVSSEYAPEYEATIRWNDPSFKIEWPLEMTTMSSKDSCQPDYKQ